MLHKVHAILKFDVTSQEPISVTEQKLRREIFTYS